jgi:hypothetical protein
MTYSARSFSSKPSAKKPKKTKTQPGSCPTCGGVECFERPRFFGGQLLTDKDLEAAQRYVIEKNKLHNRYLVGTGVVCGLAVRCDPCCDGSVTVEPGYAIDCCGNDIVLCQPETFNILDCLEKQRQEEEPYCGTKIRTPKSRGDEQPKEYCLVLFYDEEPANPITALIRDNGCSNTRCEPSRIRETFRFGIVDKQVFERRTSPTLQEKVNHYSAKLAEILEILNQPQPDPITPEIFYRVKALIVDFYQHELGIRCHIAEEIGGFEPELETHATDKNKLKLQSFFQQLQVDSQCNALLVPCTECDWETGVLLACLTVQNGNILKICNNARQTVISGSMLRYFLTNREPKNLATDWLGILLLVYNNNFSELFCCQPAGFQQSNQTMKRMAAAFSLARDFPADFQMNPFNWLQSISSETLSSLDIYDRPLEEVRPLLDSYGISVVEQRANTRDEAYSAQNLNAMSWSIPSGSQVELLISPENRVTCIRIISGGGNQ